MQAVITVCYTGNMKIMTHTKMIESSKSILQEPEVAMNSFIVDLRSSPMYPFSSVTSVTILQACSCDVEAKIAQVPAAAAECRCSTRQCITCAAWKLFRRYSGLIELYFQLLHFWKLEQNIRM